MARGLNVSDVVRVDVTIEPIGAQYRNFGIGMAIGPSDVIDVVERKRLYTTLDGVVSDFGTNAPEYQAARLYFSQEPQPAAFYVARWAQTATAGRLNGAVLSPAQQLVSAFTGITSGTLTISIDGVSKALTGLNFSTVLNLNGVASIVQAALVSAGATGAVVLWDGVQKRFTVTSGTTGPASSVGYGTGTVATAMHLTSADASAPVLGIAAESAVSCVATLADMDGGQYAYFFAAPSPWLMWTTSPWRPSLRAWASRTSTASRFRTATFWTRPPRLISEARSRRLAFPGRGASTAAPTPTRLPRSSGEPRRWTLKPPTPQSR